MSKRPFEEIYNRALDAECGLYALREIVQNTPGACTSVQLDQRNNAIEWIVSRLVEQLDALSSYAEDHDRAARKVRL